MNNQAGFLAELFVSHQGEGSWLGVRQIFLRLAGCQRKCQYCDTRWARPARLKQWKFYGPESGLRPTMLKNPVSVVETVDYLEGIIQQAGPFHSLAITGGEPLEQPKFLEAVTRLFKIRFPKMSIFLETNGLSPLNSARLKGYIDFIAVDIKLKSACGYAVGLKKYDKLLSSLTWTAGCIKAVISPLSMLGEIEAVAKLARQCRPEWDFILQPVTGKQWKSIKNQRVLELLSQKALKSNPRARVIPQVHHLMGIK